MKKKETNIRSTWAQCFQFEVFRSIYVKNIHVKVLVFYFSKLFLVLFILKGSLFPELNYVTTDWFQIGKGVRQGCILSPCLFNFYTEYIMRNTGLEEAQAGVKIAGRNINNLRYATLMAESEELKSLDESKKGE